MINKLRAITKQGNRTSTWLALPVVLLLLCATQASAQRKYTQINSDPELDTLIEQNIAANKTQDGIPGYRIQIFSDSDRKGAQEARNKIMQLYPETEAYLVYQQPYFKVRVGDYRSKLEAHALYKKLLNEFDKVFIVPDKINLPKL